MNVCTNCNYAAWNLTKSNSLHPSGDGKCTYLKLHPLDLRIPGAFSWGYQIPPSPSGGYINRRGNYPEKCIFKDGTSK